MGKKVFEVAKELGVDHRELLKKCDALNIDVRNYMSVLSDEQEQKLRGSLGGDGKKIVEKVQAPGVLCGGAVRQNLPKMRDQWA